MINVSKNQVEEAIISTSSMRAASIKLNLHYNTFIRYAKKYDLYNPNQGLKGKSKPKQEGKGKYALQDILDGKHPEYQTRKLKLRLFSENIKQNKCEICGVSEWNNKPLVCELDHIDGNPTNHSLNNLRILCPNCHSQTDTFRSKVRK
jgi:hypothetical protein